VRVGLARPSMAGPPRSRHRHSAWQSTSSSVTRAPTARSRSRWGWNRGVVVRARRGDGSVRRLDVHATRRRSGAPRPCAPRWCEGAPPQRSRRGAPQRGDIARRSQRRPLGVCMGVVRAVRVLPTAYPVGFARRRTGAPPLGAHQVPRAPERRRQARTHPGPPERRRTARATIERAVSGPSRSGSATRRNRAGCGCT
jgi:hypothetical protein